MKLYYLFLFLFLCVCCQTSETHSDPYQHIRDVKAKEVLQKAMAAAGGLENWLSLKELHFSKYFALYETSGAVESEANQKHDYLFQPEERIEISWMANNSEHKIIYTQGKAEKKIDGKLDPEANAQSLVNTILSATFVIGIPFKLLDEGAALSYAGLDTLENNQSVHVIRAEYAPGENENHSTPDVWWHYYDANDYKQLGYMVKHADHYSYVKNLSYIEAGGFLFPHERKSYRVDKDRNILNLRAVYSYTGFEVGKL